MEERLLKRKEVPTEQTWDLTLLYKSEEELQADRKKARELAKQIRRFKGKLVTAEKINACLTLLEQLYILQDHLGSYYSLAMEVDHTDSRLTEQYNLLENEFTAMNASIQFVDDEIARADEAVLRAAREAEERQAGYLDEVLRFKPHMLSQETEKALASLGQTLHEGYETYLAAKHADMKFGSFTAEGVKYPLGYSLFEDDYEYDARTPVRRAAFRAFSKKLREYENVTATAYNQCVREEKTLADLRGFGSVFDSLLFADDVPRELYDRQIDLIMTRLAPHMQKYAKLLQKLHGLDRMTYADLKLPVDPDYSPAVTIEQAREYCVKGLAVLGPDYVKMVEEAFDNRWFDYANNEGKCTGGFCASPYRANSFILLSFNGRMSDVFTMAHELGHAGHFRACSEAQSYFDNNVSGYFVESPSTMNELLLAHYLLKTNEDPRFRRWVLSNMVGNTYYHNFVTHLLEAAYQREVYKIIDKGGSVTADTLSRIFKKTLKKFWGDAVVLTRGAELTWMRQPHYYMGLYSYTYSAGLTIATEAAKRIEWEGQPAVEDWKRGLAMGSKLKPLQFALNAGVDISTDAPLLDTIETIGGYIDEICALSEKI